jgi:competence protein ComEA
LLAVVAAAVVGVAGVAIWLTMPQPDVRLDVRGQVFQVSAGPSADAPAGTDHASATATTSPIVVDVEGAVQRPGLHRLAGSSRVGDAITAAGGYSAAVDIAGAAARLNLAALLEDGAKIHVPALGDAVSVDPLATAGGGSPTTGGLIDINHASSGELETLPGIGEVTAAKIIAAREEQPFAAIEDLLGREVVGSATMDKIRELITVTP